MPIHHSWNFNIDRFLNPFVPPPPWNHIPYPIAHWFGFRKTKPKDTGNLMPIFWAFIGVFGAIAMIEAVGHHVASFPPHHVPVIVGSFGAAAVLEFYAIESPLAQPRNAIVGQVLSAVIGCGVGKLFLLSGDKFEDIKWLGGALACASATAVMALTKTVHPPAGATALLAVVDPNLIQTGWFLIPVMLLGCSLMLGAAMLINNLERRFPVYWWTPDDLRQANPIFRRRHSRKKAALEAAASESKPEDASSGEERYVSDLEANANLEAGLEKDEDTIHAADIIIKPGQVIVPEHVYLTQEEQQYLETICKRL
ncbi:hpp family [Trichoderma arundinaceum]|uniref:Hpp family n=1 Tax=Trichoderma arundinaceum TaxID=490622 RepID=A0A395NXK1_TRIAR|nr:hpp family [Trichoderma arundinaceum]